MTSPTTPSPLGRSVTKDVLDWEDVVPRAPPAPKDALGLRPDDRLALGMSLAPPGGLAVPVMGGDAHKALADALGRGASVGKREATALRRR